jgi:hypothetical protein
LRGNPSIKTDLTFVRIEPYVLPKKSLTGDSTERVDARVLQALVSAGMKPEQLIAAAFQELAGKANKIGQLNISPDLLKELLQSRK